MDPELRKRLDIGLMLLAVIAGSTAVVGSGATGVANVGAGIFVGVLITAVAVFLLTTPSWAKEDARS